MPEHHTTQLERLGAPAWARWLSIGALAGILVLNLGIITFIWSHQDAGARRGLLVALWSLAILALALLIREWNRLRRASRPRGAGPTAT